MMRRFLLIVAALVFAAAPAMAAVNITLTDEGGKVVRIDYAVTAGEDIRAFALDITVDAGTIVGISDFFTGEGAGYGIFPGTFRDFINPATPNWGDPNYTPIAPAGDPDAQPGIGFAGITIEMGSLYVGEPNKPADSGTLCKVTVSDGCNLCAAVNASRGGVVLEDATGVTPTFLPSACIAVAGLVDCYPAAWTAQFADWEALGKPDCWCGAAGVAVQWPYQCYGDIDNLTQGLPKYRVYTNDFNALVANWSKKITDTTLNPCADLDHKAQGLPKYRVYTNDFNRLVAYWAWKDTALQADAAYPCPGKNQP